MKHGRWWMGVLVSVLAACSGGSHLPQVSLDQARADHEAGRVVLIDIREPREHASGVAAGAQLLPMSQLGQRLGEIPQSADKPVYLICNTQNRSQAVLSGLLEKGYKHVHYVHGGMSGWASRGWPMVAPGGS
ncbi:MAG: rhodanese-like domain-containing protein [Betaproteobacteria bacterium]|nr:rhodanese-like domain-containing protein [Betaproteobacteria bacterium]